HTCVVTSGGLVKCWGGNSKGQLGIGANDNRGDEAGEMASTLSPSAGATLPCRDRDAALPFVDLNGDVAVAIALGYEHSCALLVGGLVKCWGDNRLGEMGLGDTRLRGDEAGEMGASTPPPLSRAALPYVILNGAVAVAIALGFEHTCVLLQVGGSVKCFGQNHMGMLGTGTTEYLGDDAGEMASTLPRRSDAALPYVDLNGAVPVAIVCGSQHTCAQLVGGSVKCWDQNGNGQLGLGDTGYRGNSAHMGVRTPLQERRCFARWMAGMEVLTKGCVDWQANLPAVNFGADIAECAV
ncbi:regulator of chromosome condensation 1/beta-lactamase-inhibitor protein II, partial [Baffinella frigidus]